ncbi:hypothetical protein EA472_17745 [Natrarchaeobius oligotrophus]|uniref:Uncharacterized protein n=2 Tax=Natrarchaeobius TaxID=2501796 RepID=A0A3N6MM52_NATCH|nr:hypothetical protein EA472_17745 [Natrarchaeobius chitinivorans]
MDDLATACKRFGPGRLPGADRRTIGAGYAGASAALGFALAFAVAMVVLPALGVTSDLVHPFWGASALVALPFVVPTAFAASALVWRVLPASGTAAGLVGGLLATLLTYLGSLVLVFLVAIPLAWSSGTGTVLTEATGLVVLVGFFAAVLTAWLTIPVGCVCGAVYERARTIS